MLAGPVLSSPVTGAYNRSRSAPHEIRLACRTTLLRGGPLISPAVTPSRSNAQDGAAEALLQAVREATRGHYDILGELGRRGPDSIVYLARASDSGRLVALQLAPTGGADGSEYSLIVTDQLGPAVPMPTTPCPQCGAELDSWARACARCGADVAGDGPSMAGDAAQRQEQIRQLAAAGGYELLGTMRRSDDGAPVHFARRPGSSDVVALRLATSPGGAGIELRRTQVLRAAGGEAAGDATGDSAAALARHVICPACGKEYERGTRFCAIDGSALLDRANPATLVGQVVAGRYHVLRKLGEGGMGEVYLAQHVKLRRLQALKVMRSEMSRDPDAASRFNREASNAAEIDHANVARVYDFGETPEGLVYLSMEYVDGISLSALLKSQGALPPAVAASLAMQIADGLAAAHQLKVVHRDLKPDNLLVVGDPDGPRTVKIVDFGIAKAMESEAQKVTRTGFVIGTPAYMSPEQLLGGAVDGRSDLYSLGCVLYEMLTGAPPFEGPSREAMVNRRLIDPPPRPSKAAQQVPRALDAVVSRAMARAVEDRYQTAAELRDDLRRAIEGQSSSRAPTRTPLLVAAAVVAAGTAAWGASRLSGDALRGGPRDGATVQQAQETGTASGAGTPPVARAPAGASGAPAGVASKQGSQGSHSTQGTSGRPDAPAVGGDSPKPPPPRREPAPSPGERPRVASRPPERTPAPSPAAGGAQPPEKAPPREPTDAQVTMIQGRIRIAEYATSDAAFRDAAQRLERVEREIDALEGEFPQARAVASLRRELAAARNRNAVACATHAKLSGGSTPCP
jgi:serine/threonine-protein kinase